MKIFFVFIALVLFCVAGIHAQNHISFNHLTVEDGLSQSAVTCIFQDKQGFMWFGTQDGLNRYDGYRFKIFKSDPLDSNSLSDNFIFSIYEDKSGTMYVETQSGKFHIYFPETESFVLVEKDSIDLAGSIFNSVGAYFEESSGIKWTGGAGSGTLAGFRAG